MHDIYRVCFDESFVGVVLLAMTEKYKTIIKLTSFATLHVKILGVAICHLNRISHD